MDKVWKDKKVIAILGVAFLYCIGLIAYAWISSANTTKDLVGFRYGVPLAIGSIFLLIGSIFVFWLVCVKKAEMHNVYLGMAIVIYSLFLWAMPPLHGHDIQFHYDTTYVLSDEILGGEIEELKIGKNSLHNYPRRECDRFMHYSLYNNYIQAYADMQTEMFSVSKAEETQLKEVATYQGEISVPKYFYYPQAIGFSIARILGLNVFWLMFLGRLFICMVCVFLTCRTIKNAPFAKELFLVCGLIPTTMFSFANVSRDALIIAVSFYFISKCLQISYSSKKNKWWDYFLLFISLVLVVPYKIVYVALVLLLALLVCKKYKEKTFNKKHLVICGIFVTALASVFVMINFNYLRNYLTGENSYSMGENAPFTVPYILNNLGQTVGVVINTLVTSSVRYFANMIAIGDLGGGIHKEMVVVEVLFMILLVLMTSNSKGKECEISAIERLIITLTWIGVSGLVIFAFLLCTPYTNDVIIGIQGRYFAPALPLMMLSFCNVKWIKEIKNRYWIRFMDCLNHTIVKKSVLLGVYGLSLFVVVNMYVWVMTYVHPS